MTTVSTILTRHAHIAGLRPNPVQQAYGDYVARGIACAREHGQGQLFAEAETGSGKTIGYLVAAGLDCVAHRSRAIIATHTLALQRQILDPKADTDDMRRALAIIKAETGVTLTAAARIGRRNFVDAERATRAVARRIKRGGITDIVADDLTAFAQWATENPGGEIREYMEDNALGHLPGGLLNDAVCVTSRSSHSGASWLAYQRHVDASRGADILVTNHAMLVANSLYGSRLLHNDGDERSIGALIVDECDRMESAARNATGDLLPLREFESSVRDLLEDEDRSDDDIDTFSEVLSALLFVQDYVIELYNDPHTQHPDDSILFCDEMSKASRAALMQHMQALADLLAPVVRRTGHDDALQEVQAYASDFLSVYHTLRNLHHATDAQRKRRADHTIVALRWSPERGYPSFRVFRLHPARVLKSMWADWVTLPTQPDADEEDDAPSVASATPELPPPVPRVSVRACALILTSATISPPSQSGDLNFVELSTAYGIHAASNPCHAINEEGETFAPKKFGNVKFVFSAHNAPPVYIRVQTVSSGKKTKDVIVPVEEDDEEDMANVQVNPEWIAYTTTAIRAASAEGGRILVLTNSYRVTRLLAASVRAAGLSPIEKTKLLHPSACINQFVANPDGLFITPGAWEGFNIHGRIGPDGVPLRRAIRHLVITQIPFSPPDNPVKRALLRYLLRKGYALSKARGIVFAGMLSAALRKFKQGVGRGLRSEDDAFTLWLTDARFPRSRVMSMATPVAEGVRVKPEFKLAIPQRFRRDNRIRPSEWDQGDLLMIDGRRVTYESLVARFH